MANSTHFSIAAIADRVERPDTSEQYLQGTFSDKSELIPRVNSLGVKRGDVSQLLHTAPALVFEGDTRINALVASTLEWLGLDEGSARHGTPAFDNIFDLAEITAMGTRGSATCSDSCRNCSGMLRGSFSYIRARAAIH